MNNITDNAFVPSTEEQVTDHFQDTDNLADADGVDARNGQGVHATTKETTPSMCWKNSSGNLGSIQSLVSQSGS